MTDVFKPKEETNSDGNGTATEGDNQTSHLDLVVQQKGENWRDIEVLAKGKLESDAYIARLEEENKQLKDSKQEGDEVSALLEALKGKATEAGNENPPANENNAGGTQEEKTSLDVTEETLERLVEQTITKREKSATEEANVRQANQLMQEKFGDSAVQELQKRAGELSMSVDRLRELAAESPTAFMSLMGVSQETTSKGGVFNTGGNSTRTESNNNVSTDRDWAYYKKMRKEQKSLYYTPAVQRQLLADKQRLGDKFGA